MVEKVIVPVVLKTTSSPATGATPPVHSPGTGFLIKGTASFIKSGPDFDIMKETFSWARATMAVTADTITQTL